MAGYDQHAQELKDAVGRRALAADDLRAKWTGDPEYAGGLEALARDAAAREQTLNQLGGYRGKAYRYRAACRQARDHERVVGQYVAWTGVPANVDPAGRPALVDAHRALADRTKELDRLVAALSRHLETDHTGENLDLDDLVEDSEDLADNAFPPTNADLIDHLRDADTVLAEEEPSDDQAKALADNWEKAIERLDDPDGGKATELRAAVDELTVHQLAAPLFARLAASGQKAGA